MSSLRGRKGGRGGKGRVLDRRNMVMLSEMPDVPLKGHPLDPDVLVADAGALTSTQLQILIENQRKRQALQQAKSKLFELREEHSKLQTSHEADLDEQYDVLEYLHHDNQEKEKRIAELERVVREREREAAESQTRVAEEGRKERERLERKHGLEMSKIIRQVEELKATIQELEGFGAERDGLVRRVAELEAELTQERNNRLQQGMKLERKYIRQNLSMKADYEAKMDETVRELQSKLDERLSARVLGVLNQNEMLRKELEACQDAADDLRDRCEDLEAERDRLASDMQLRNDLASQEAKARSSQARELREAEAALKDAESRLAQLADAATRGQARLESEAREREEALRRELDSMQMRMRAAEEDAASVRALAQEVLAQRGDVEAFLLSSLSQIRREMDAERSSGALGGGGGPWGGSSRGSEKSAPGSRAGSALESSPSRVDIAKLSWEERERVLRLLFMKVNAKEHLSRQQRAAAAAGGVPGGTMTSQASSALPSIRIPSMPS